MILEMLFNPFYHLVNWVVSSIPNITLPITFSHYFAPVANLVGYINTFVSLPLIVTGITVILLVDNWSLIVKVVLKIWDMLPLT